ncbi:MAG: hypothetical protein ABSF03_29135 [Streptosporangiaceae bacterium]
MTMAPGRASLPGSGAAARLRTGPLMATMILPNGRLRARSRLRTGQRTTGQRTTGQRTTGQRTTGALPMPRLARRPAPGRVGS